MIKVNHLPNIFRNRAVKDKIEDVCLQNDVVFMALFGSFAKGKQTPKSDIDILIRFDSSREKSLLDLIHTENEMRKVFKRRVDLLSQGSISPHLRNEILRSMKVVYEKR
ncbi:MAG TPA: nucleotidyltransferase domain-containing protein [Planctomycetota bacterium]|nr:nucleotidyltransferase domain-containing protein [Planctomycetota bacterium]